ncbi:MAG: thermosome subunit, partial [Euryarchaeota archaeon]|nr:thermosome subunit [Euryarchaeota archaeon]
MAIEAFAAALEIVPRTLAQNAGRDPIDEILALSAAQANDQDNGAWIGIDGTKGAVTRMDKMGIIDPLFVASHAISGATTAAISILRIDDVLWAKQGPQTPDWSNQIDDN